MTTGNHIADGNYEDYLKSCSPIEEDKRCPYCLEEHCPGEPECEAPEIENRECKEYKYHTTKPNETNTNRS